MSASDTKNDKKESDPNRVLRNVVVAMGMVLIGGCLLLFTLLALGVHKKDKPKTERPAKEVAAQSECEPNDFALAADEYLDDYELDGKVVTIYSDTDDGRYVMRRIDICTGKLLQQLTIRESLGD